MDVKSDKNHVGARAIAFYLPQYYPTPENDAWWGPGFTEWTSVARARPLFKGHYQPHVPADLGFYDLRLSETREAQAELAAAYGIEAFCYWHYWFRGKRLLARPFEEVLRSGTPTLSFCLAWANETWSRRWLGEERQILIKQEYSEADDVRHARWLASAFADPRYMRVDGRPLFLIYRPRDLPNVRRTVDVLRGECVKQGLTDPVLLGTDAHAPGADFREDGLDGTVIFEPQLSVLPRFDSDSISIRKLVSNMRFRALDPRLKIYDDERGRRLMTRAQMRAGFYPTVFVGWDNSPRRGRNAIIFVNTTPDSFAKAIRAKVQSVATIPWEHRLVFVNAWNEWAEGNHLEPDQLHGQRFLESVSAGLLPG